jgi:hypothetical protein
MKASNDAAHSDFPLSISTMESLTFTFISEGGKKALVSTWLETTKASNDAAYSDFPLSTPRWKASLSTFIAEGGKRAPVST